MNAYYPDVSRTHFDRSSPDEPIHGINWLPPGNYLCDLKGCSNCHKTKLQSRPLPSSRINRPSSIFRPPYTPGRVFPFYISNLQPPINTISSVLEQYHVLTNIRRYIRFTNAKVLIHDKPDQMDRMFYLKYVLYDPNLTIIVKGKNPNCPLATSRLFCNHIIYVDED